MTTITNLLARLLRDDAEPAALLTSNSTPWDELLAQAQEHGVAPLLHQRLRGRAELLPKHAAATLAHSYYATHSAHLLYSRELTPLLRTCAARGIPVILLKGLALAHTLYGDPGLRPLRDADLLVRERDLPTLRVLLEAQGYMLKPEPLDGGLPRSSLHLSFVKPLGAGQALVEVHWLLLRLPSVARVVDHQALFAAGVPLTLEGQPAFALPPTLQLLQLLGHLIAHHSGEQRLIWLYDMHLLARTGTVEWPTLARLLARLRFASAARPLLEQLVALFDTPIPPAFLRQLEAAATPADRLLGWFVAPGTEDDLRRGLLRLARQPGLRARLATLRGLLLPGPAYMRQRYGGSLGPLPLAYARRMLRGLIRGLRLLKKGEHEGVPPS